jgi:hypothetical protein
MREHFQTDVTRLSTFKIINGELKESGSMMYDKLNLPGDLIQPCVLRGEDKTYLLDMGIKEHTDGQWLVEIEGKASVRELAFVPVRKIKVLGGGVPFECMVDEIKIIARVLYITQKV